MTGARNTLGIAYTVTTRPMRVSEIPNAVPIAGKAGVASSTSVVVTNATATIRVAFADFRTDSRLFWE
jgi:hypothetical protein